MAYRRERIEPEFFNWMGVDSARPGSEETVTVRWPPERPQESIDPATVLMSTTRLYAEQLPEGPKYELNLNGLISWLERQNPDTWYNWHDSCQCLIARFLRDATGSLRSCQYEMVCGDSANYHFIGANAGHGAHPSDWTFGQALARAKRVRDRGLPHTGREQERQRQEYDYLRTMPVMRNNILSESWMS